MNRRNVEALVEALNAMSGTEGPGGEDYTAYGLAEHLAARGILAPWTMTDQQLAWFGDHRALLVPDRLERIARGQL